MYMDWVTGPEALLTPGWSSSCSIDPFAKKGDPLKMGLVLAKLWSFFGNEGKALFFQNTCVQHLNLTEFVFNVLKS